MADKSGIEWTEATWNPITGCDKVSPGCKHCYAETLSARLKAMGAKNYANGFQLTLQPHMLTQPLRWRRPRTIFVNSMSDLFHDGIPDDYINDVFGVMAACEFLGKDATPGHRFQILTKRAERMRKYMTEDRSLLFRRWAKAAVRHGGGIDPDSLHDQVAFRYGPMPHVWLGVSVENADYLDRIDYLREVPAAVRFLSIEPLLGPIPALDLRDIHWVIVGGESGIGARTIDPTWVREIRDQCIEQNVPFFFKQWGGVRKKEAGRELDGRTWDEMPVNS